MYSNRVAVLVESMENILSDGVWLEEIESEALKVFEANQAEHADKYVRFMPSGQVSNTIKRYKTR